MAAGDWPRPMSVRTRWWERRLGRRTTAAVEFVVQLHGAGRRAVRRVASGVVTVAMVVRLVGLVTARPVAVRAMLTRRLVLLVARRMMSARRRASFGVVATRPRRSRRS